MAIIVADSDVLIDALRGHQPAAGRIARELKTGTLATTAVTAFELLSGAKDAAVLRQVGQLLAAVRILPFDEPAATAAADAKRTLEAAGTPIGTADYLIAGICLARSAVLLTRNRKHFVRVPGLIVGRVELEGG